MAGDEPIDVGVLSAIWAAKHPVTLEATIEDIDAQLLAVRKVCEELAPRIMALETATEAIHNAANTTTANLDAMLRRTDLTSVASAGDAIEQSLRYVQAIAKDTDANPNT